MKKKEQFILSTTDIIPGREYEVINVIFNRCNEDQVVKTLEAMQKTVIASGADGLMGIKVVALSTDQPVNRVMVSGTAVKFIN